MVYCTKKFRVQMFFALLPKTSSLLWRLVVKLGQFYEVLITRSLNGSALRTKNLSNEEVFGKTANDFLTSNLTPQYIVRRNVHFFAVICRDKATEIWKTLNNVLFYNRNHCSQVEMLTISSHIFILIM